MPRYAAFLRAINVGGHVVKMDALARLFGAMGFSDVETFIASGNVVFDARQTKAAALERTIASALEKALGYEVATFVRTLDELAAIAACRPFPQAAMDTAAAFNVGLLAAPLDAAATARLMALRTDIDDFHADGREVYWLCRTRQSQSTFSNNLFERRVGAKATFRSLSTMGKMAERFATSPAPQPPSSRSSAAPRRRASSARRSGRA